MLCMQLKHSCLLAGRQKVTCEPVIPYASSDVPCRDNLCCDKVLLCAVDLHPIVTLHKHNAQEEATDHLSHQYKEKAL